MFSDSSSFSIGNVQCQDGHFVDATLAQPSPLGEVQQLAAMTRNATVTPGMGDFFRRTVGCTGWPVRITNPRAALSVQGTVNPVLLVHTTFDPATSPEYARGMPGRRRPPWMRILLILQCRLLGRCWLAD